MRIGIVSLLALAVAACTALQPAERPDITLVNLEFTDLTVFETSGVFTVRISNANNEPLTVQGGAYRLYLNGVKIGKGLSSNRVEVPRLGTATDEVTVYVNNLALATRIARLLDEKDLDYRLKAKLYLEGVFGTRRLSTVYEGRLSLEDLQPAEELPALPGGEGG